MILLLVIFVGVGCLPDKLSMSRSFEVLSPQVAGLSNPGRNMEDYPRYLSITDCLATRYKDLDYDVSVVSPESMN